MPNTTKEEMIEFIKTLPDDVSVVDIMYHCYVKETVIQRLNDCSEKKVNTISEQEVKDQIQQWSK